MGGVWGLRVDNQLHLVRLLCNWEVRCCDFEAWEIHFAHSESSLSPFEATVLPLTVHVTKAKSFLDTISRWGA